MRSNELTHLDDKGNARMVDVGGKLETVREAVARCRVLLAPATFELVKAGNLKKGDVLTVAQVAGIQAAKRTWELIPLCHQINMTFVGVTLTLNETDHAVDIEATARTKSETGVEMEAWLPPPPPHSPSTTCARLSSVASASPTCGSSARAAASRVCGRAHESTRRGLRQHLQAEGHTQTPAAGSCHYYHAGHAG